MTLPLAVFRSVERFLRSRKTGDFERDFERDF